MSNILEFRVLAGRRGPRSNSVPSCPAEVVLFPGVRYERAAEPLEPSPAPTARNGGGRRTRRGTK